jgi:hypothetical protein
MTRERAMMLAQRSADHVNQPMAVLNLNPFGALYVIREWDDRFDGDRQLVAKVMPAKT